MGIYWIIFLIRLCFVPEHLEIKFTVDSDSRNRQRSFEEVMREVLEDRKDAWSKLARL